MTKPVDQTDGGHANAPRGADPRAGWNALSTCLVVQRAGHAPGLLHYHFQSVSSSIVQNPKPMLLTKGRHAAYATLQGGPTPRRRGPLPSDGSMHRHRVCWIEAAVSIVSQVIID